MLAQTTVKRPNFIRCKDLMGGLAIGDASGAGYENRPYGETRAIIDLSNYLKNPRNGSEHVPGHYTDDTQMALAVAKLLYSSKEFNRENLANFLCHDYHIDRREGYSRSTKNAFDTLLAENYIPFDKSDRNGAIPRSVPIGVLTDTDKVIDYAVINSELLHNTPPSIASGVFIALASHYMFHELGKPEYILDFCLDEMSKCDLEFDDETLDYLRDVSKMGQIDESLLFGEEFKDFGVPINAKKTAGAALYILSRHHEDPLETLVNSILLGGDTDTVASVCLGIVASRTGLDGLPKSLIDNFENGEYGFSYIERVGKRLASVLPIDVETIRRYNYTGKRQNMVVHDVDGIVVPTDGVYIEEIMRRLMGQIDYRRGDYIISLDSTGYIPGLSASTATGLPLINAKKAEIDIENKIEFCEPGTPHSQLFIYNLPKGARVVIIDDEIMTGDTMVNLVKALEISGNEILGIVVPIESSKYNARKKIEDMGYKLVSHTVHNLE